MNALVLTPDATILAKPIALAEGDVVAKPNGTYLRSIKRNDSGAVQLCFPKRGEVDPDAKFGDYVASGKVLVVGRVELRSTSKPKAKAQPKAAERVITSPTDGKLCGARTKSGGVCVAQGRINGRCVGHRGQPSAGVELVATTTAPAPTEGGISRSAAADVMDAMATAMTTLANALRG